MSQPRNPLPYSPQPNHPASLLEFGKRALDNLWDENKDLKHYMGLAEVFRLDGKELVKMGDLDSAFVQFTKAATLFLETLPLHRDYYTLLNPSQRQSLRLNGQDSLDSLRDIKPTLLDRFDRWLQAHPGRINDERTPDADQRQRLPDDAPARAAAKYRQKQEETVRGTKKDVVAAARQAVPVPQGLATMDYEHSRPQHDLVNHIIVSDETDVYNIDSGREVRMQEVLAQRIREEEAEFKAARQKIGLNPHAQPGAVSSYDSPGIMSLDNPIYEGDPTGSKSMCGIDQDFRRLGNQTQAFTIGKVSVRSPLHLPPTTTTSPPTQDGRVYHPQLMSEHQKRQGYYPSLNSKFVPRDEPTSITSSILLSVDKSGGGGSKKGMYLPEVLPSPASPQSRASPPIPTLPTASRPTRAAESETAQNLKNVSLPRECLPRFLAIAGLNTITNKETCGLLLGKDTGHRYTVTTLLIPKQHATSDTCTIDNDEEVIHLKKERSLITLGWIHTHPSQSCFMSSMDLHIHSEFQRILPESFAVVCAPNSNPNFGIFRLTDPPGLTTVLECTVKEAFHPHSDLFMYTDADKGHVQMKDYPLEVVDLR